MKDARRTSVFCPHSGKKRSMRNSRLLVGQIADRRGPRLDRASRVKDVEEEG